MTKFNKGLELALMRKGSTLHFLLLGSAVLIYGFVAGCGQVNQPANIQSSSAPPSGLSVMGTVYVYGKENQGTQDNPKYNIGDKVPSALITLSGADGTSVPSRTTVTNSNGEYVFDNVAFGTYRLIASAEGCPKYISRPFTTSRIIMDQAPGAPSIPADESTFTQDIILNSWPIITSVSPEAGIIADNQTFVYTFNEAINKDSIIANIIPMGPREFEVNKYADSNCTVALSNGNKTLTITPKSSLVPNMKYSIFLLVLDENGYPLRTGIGSSMFGGWPALLFLISCLISP